MKEKNTRVEFYDYVRFMAIVLVVLGHASYLCHSTGLGGVEYELPSTLNGHYDDWVFRVIRAIGLWAYGFHMPMFFALAGAVYALKEAVSFDALVKKKSISLLLPYLVYGLLYMIPLKCFSGFYDFGNIRYITRDFLSGGGESGHLWFLIELFWCFVFAYVLIKYVAPKSKAAVMLIVIIAANVDLDSIPAFWGFSGAFDDVVWFMTGYFFEKNFREGFEKTDLLKKVCLFGFLFIVSQIQNVYTKEGSLVYIFIMISMFGSLALLVYSVVKENKLISRFVHFISKVSVYVYIFHDPMDYVILKYAFKYDWLSDGKMVYVYYFMRTAGVFIVSVLMGCVVSKLKECFRQKRIGHKQIEKI